MEDSDLLMYQVIFEYCRKHPLFVAKVIEAASSGVRAFAESQSDSSSAIGARLIDILSSNKKIKTHCFDKKEIMESIAFWFKGTEAYTKIETNLVIDKED